jgi:hypothetical protein
MVLAPDSNVQSQRAGAAWLGVAIALAPGTATFGFGDSAAALSPATLAPLSVDPSAVSLRATMPLLLRADARAAATVLIGPDPRTVFPNRN